MTNLRIINNLKLNKLLLIIALNFPLVAYSFEVGSKGPGGGIVFYVDQSGSKGLEAKASDESGKLTWVKAIAAAGAHGSGWHLPTKEELNLLYEQRTVVGGFDNTKSYWSSTANDNSNAWRHDFDDFGMQYHSDKNGTLKARAIRAF
jgi:hypothetical protein